MTPEREKERTEEYRIRIAEALREGGEEGYHELEMICEERDYDYLATRNKELLLFRRIVLVWLAERRVQKPIEETIIGRTAAFMNIPLSELTMKQLIETYTLVKFALFRLEDKLPEEERIEGVSRAMYLGISPEALILTARMEADKEREVLGAYAEALAHPVIRAEFSTAGQMEAVLREYLTWDGH